jgi:predicted Rossmann-fold nucleotide-binding protein
LRTDATYGVVAELARAMARTGWHIASGGGPGAMEAANLGAWLSAGDDGDLRRALATLAREARFDATDEYLRAGQTVLDEFGDGVDSLAVPTWFYGHEPTNQFATHVAKYFANSIREDGLLAIATRGVVFAPGSAGTVQEIFQDATQNHYEVFGVVSPMVFLGTDYWRSTLGAEPLLRQLAAGRPYESMIGVADTAAEAIAFLQTHPPLSA